VGDIAVNIARRVVELVEEPELKPLVAIPIMAENAQRIFKSSLDAFVNSDDRLAEQVIQDDDILDGLHEQIFHELLTYMMENPLNDLVV
jgi:phosphate transport system protein